MCVLQLKDKCVYDVKTIVQSITQGVRTELERLRAIWVWLCHNIGAFAELHKYAYESHRSFMVVLSVSEQVYKPCNQRNVVFAEYDVSGFLGRSEKLSSPEEVIAAGRGVCCGYSSLCTEMCR